ncbi:MAG TPA: DUF971 domain-containing protein [Thermodesulfobacteriota bacterium]|nr:DUF971 domain-containing protein [Thermodesulfobacteriota bacterium]
MAESKSVTLAVMKPKEISEFSDTALSILWDDGHESIYLYEDLRKYCPCASCNELRKASQKTSSFKRSIPVNVSTPDIRPINAEHIGKYAIRFYWSDRHSTGIYTFDFLRELCSCERCN